MSPWNNKFAYEQHGVINRTFAWDLEFSKKKEEIYVGWAAICCISTIKAVN